jgi:hypothetical protein
MITLQIDIKIYAIGIKSATMLQSKHNKISIMFSQIPNEITQDVFDRLPIYECQSVVDAYKDQKEHHGRMKAIYEERVSLDRYFTLNLYDGKKMMKLLAESDSYVFGSRAIEYFNPNTAGSDSDWNFHVSSSPRLRHHFMKSMEMFGVKWQDVTTSFFKNIKPGHISIVIKRSELDFVIKDSKRFELNDFYRLALRLFIHSSNHIRRRNDIDTILFFEGTIEFQMLNCRDTTEEREPYEFGSMMWREGIIKFKDKDVKIQMAFINDPDYTHTQLLHDSCLSIQQCFIGGFGALHMYGKLASQNISYKWDRSQFAADILNGEKINQLAHKYTVRGYQIKLRSYDKDSAVNNRSYSDSESIFIPFSNHLNCSEEIWNLMQMRSCHMYWMENRFDTYFKYTKYSNYFSHYTLTQCKDIMESMTMALDEQYLTKHASL